MVSREVEDYAKQQRLEAEGVTNRLILQLQEGVGGGMIQIAKAAEASDAKVLALAAESERCITLVKGESEKFAENVSADKADMDTRSEAFRVAGARLEAQLSEGLGKIRAAQVEAEAANPIQSESTRTARQDLRARDGNAREQPKEPRRE